MFIGYLFAVLAMLSIGVLGILSKLADRPDCTPLNSALVLFGGSSVIMALYVRFIQGETLNPPKMVSGTAIFFGALAVLAFWVFLYGLQFGKITTSWIFMNLSGIVPAALSTILYHEKLGVLKALVLGLVVLSIFLLWKDKQQESGQVLTQSEVPARANVKIWITAMLCAFLLNGICPFGLRVLAGRGLAQQYTPVYLVYWYLAGFGFGLLGLIKSRQKLSLANLTIGLIMAVASVGGQFFMGLALSHGVAGSVVFMLGMGASMCVVVLGGLIFFHERVGTYAKLGIVIGLVAALLLGATG
ncbi:MAG TPA: DMT family transporter [Terriglobales bacterium]|jgi:drug/metabolite transporter (DMT)-like permease|nr:DMT family transporter [Terriglobales bacterium]